MIVSEPFGLLRTTCAPTSNALTFIPIEATTNSHNMKTQAAILRAQKQPLSVETLEIDSPKRGEVLLKMVGAGVCHSDYHAVDGHTTNFVGPMILGHEGAGLVAEVGEGVDWLKPGDKVILSLDSMCGRCRNCTAGHPSLCETNFTYGASMPDGTTRFHKNGERINHRTPTFTDYSIALEDKCVLVPDDTNLEAACLISCGIITGVGAVVNRAKVPTGSTHGRLRLRRRRTQRRPRAADSPTPPKSSPFDTVDFKLEKAAEMGATHFVNAAQEDPVDRILEITGGGADYAFEVVGLPAIAKQAFNSTRPLGTTVLVGVFPTGAEMAVDGWELLRGRTILGNWHGDGRPRVDFLWLLEMEKQGKLKLHEMITRYRPLDEINEAFADMTAGEAARNRTHLP